MRFNLPPGLPVQLVVWLAVSSLPVFGEEIRSVTSPSERGTIEDRTEKVRGDSGKWRDEPRLQVSTSPPSSVQSLDDWADEIDEGPARIASGKDVWLIYRTEQLDDNDRIWVESVTQNLEENRITVVLARATWQGNYRKNFTWYSVTGVNLGTLPVGEYKVEWIEKPFAFQQFDDPAKREKAWPSDLAESGESGESASALAEFQVVVE